MTSFDDVFFRPFHEFNKIEEYPTNPPPTVIKSNYVFPKSYDRVICRIKEWIEEHPTRALIVEGPARIGKKTLIYSLLGEYNISPILWNSLPPMEVLLGESSGYQLGGIESTRAVIVDHPESFRELCRWLKELDILPLISLCLIFVIVDEEVPYYFLGTHIKLERPSRGEIKLFLDNQLCELGIHTTRMVREHILRSSVTYEDILGYIEGLKLSTTNSSISCTTIRKDVFCSQNELLFRMVSLCEEDLLLNINQYTPTLLHNNLDTRVDLDYALELTYVLSWSDIIISYMDKNQCWYLPFFSEYYKIPISFVLKGYKGKKKPLMKSIRNKSGNLKLRELVDLYIKKGSKCLSKDINECRVGLEILSYLPLSFRRQVKKNLTIKP